MQSTTSSHSRLSLFSQEVLPDNILNLQLFITLLSAVSPACCSLCTLLGRTNDILERRHRLISRFVLLLFLLPPLPKSNYLRLQKETYRMFATVRITSRQEGQVQKIAISEREAFLCFLFRDQFVFVSCNAILSHISLSRYPRAKSKVLRNMFCKNLCMGFAFDLKSASISEK
jgi:hypothetical protein